MIQFGGLVALANTSLALLAVTILWLDPSAARGCWPCRSSSSSSPTGRTSPSARSTSGSSCSTSPAGSSSTRRSSTRALVALLDHARDMFRAELAEVLLDPRIGADEALCARRSLHDGEPELDGPGRPVPGDDPLHVRGRGASAGRSSTMPGPAGRRDAARSARRWSARCAASPALIGALIDRQPPDRGHELQRATTCACSRRSPTRPRSRSRTASSSSRWPSCRGSRSSSATRPITTR